MIWRCATYEFDTRMPIVMGILNVTPDSFSDGGQHDGFDAALAHAERMAEEGARIIDVGGESARRRCPWTRSWRACCRWCAHWRSAMCA